MGSDVLKQPFATPWVEASLPQAHTQRNTAHARGREAIPYLSTPAQVTLFHSTQQSPAPVQHQSLHGLYDVRPGLQLGPPQVQER